MEPFKNFFNNNEINKLSNLIKINYEDFDQNSFYNSLFNNEWEEKELKQRMRAVSLSLGKYLPSDYLISLKILKKVSINFNGIFHMIFPDFVEVFGLNNFNESLDALKFFTTNSSSEFAIRVFIIKYPQTIKILKSWTNDPNEHVRRLATEGSRPRLPWAIALPQFKKDPSQVIEILDLLKDDESMYVRKSVANNLNDISKDNPKIVKELFQKWYGVSDRTNWIIKHGARTLLKSADLDVLNIFGFSNIDISIKNFKCENEVKIGEYLNFSFQLNANKPLGKLRIEYKIELIRLNNKTSCKVFKISESNEQNNFKIVNKNHSFKPVTTRKYYSGEHKITIIVNGKELETKSFDLRKW